MNSPPGVCVSADDLSLLFPDVSMKSGIQGLRPCVVDGIEMSGESRDVSSADTTNVERADTKWDLFSSVTLEP